MRVEMVKMVLKKAARLPMTGMSLLIALMPFIKEVTSLVRTVAPLDDVVFYDSDTTCDGRKTSCDGRMPFLTAWHCL